MHQAAYAQSQKKGNKWGPVQIKSLDPGSDKDRWGSHDRRLIRKTKNQGSHTKQRGWKNGNRLSTFLIILCVLDAEKMVLLFLNLTSFIVWDDITWPCMVVVPWYRINSCVHFRLPVGNIWRLLSISPQFQLLQDIFVKPLSYCQSLRTWYRRKRKRTSTSALF